MREADKALLEALGLPDSLPGEAGEGELELTEEEKRFDEERKSIIGGTDSAVLAGFSSYRTEWDLAAEKRGILPPWRGNERTEIGRALEEPVARLYAKRTGERLRRVNAVVRDRDQAYFGGHPDRMVIGKRKGVEIKTVEWGREKWSGAGEPIRVPPDYLVQCQHYMAITGSESWELIALMGLSSVRWYTLARNDRIIAALRERARVFWERYVVGDEMPEIGPSDRAREYIKERFPAPTSADLVIANEAQRHQVERWLRVKARSGRWAKLEEACKMRVQTCIGEASGIIAGETTITWRRDRDSITSLTDWEGLLRMKLEQHGLDVTAAEIANFTRDVVTRKGARKLLPRTRK